jgi:hypothetical protein
LERRHYGGHNEAAIAKKHCAQDGGAFRCSCKLRVNACEQVPAHPRDSLRDRWRGAIHDLEQFSAAQRAREIDSLACEVAMQIERAGIEEISWWARAKQGLDAIARAKPSGRACCLRSAV